VEAGVGCVQFFVCVAAVLSVRDIMFKNNNQSNNDNHYQQSEISRQAFCEKNVTGSILLRRV
jgi:hypothetical protein